MEVREEVPTSSSTAAVEAPAENSGPFWLQLGFVMPTEEEALRALAVENSNRTPLFNNIQFTNRYAASYIGGAILDRAADIKSLASQPRWSTYLLGGF